MFFRLKNLLDNLRARNNNLTEILFYILVGIFGVAADFVFFLVLRYLGLPLLFAQWGGASFCFIHNHFWHHLFVFKHRQSFSRTTFLSTFFSIISVVVSGPALVLLQGIFDNLIFNKIIVTGVAAALLFAVRKFFIFKDKKV
jgi:putative flippase GtrA